LVDQITLHQQGGGRSPSAAAGAPVGSNLASAVQTAAALLQSGRSNEAIEVLDRTLPNISDFNALMKLSEIYQSIGRLDRSKKTMQRAIDISPAVPEGWFNLALVEIADGSGMASARSNLDQALRLSDERLKTAPAAANLRKVWDEDSRYKQVRELLK
jgi:tetratricopeptide (TPR) repeat protein